MLLKPCLAATTLAAAMALTSAGAIAATSLSDTPVLDTVAVPPNVMLTLSVEWPTGTVAAYNDNAITTAPVTGEQDFRCSGRDGGLGVCYFSDRTYLGYFDSNKCYSYQLGATAADDYFVPVAVNSTRNCSASTGRYSGNFLNWAVTHAIDAFRYAMTGGDRVVDTATNTVVEKARHSGQGGHGQFPIKRVRNTSFTANGVTVPALDPRTVVPGDANWATAAYARVNADGSALALGTSRNGLVLQLANNPAFLQSFSTRSYRYVKVQKSSGSTSLWLAEVRVVDTGGVNRAQGRTATQSNTANGRGANLAVDGNTNGDLAAGSVTDVGNGRNQPWWQVDLGSARNLSRIEIWDRTDGTDADRGNLSNFYIFAADTDISNRSIEDLLRDPLVWKFQQSASPDPTLTLAPATTDRASDYLAGRVQVCNANVGLESNCLAYGTSYKPVGVLQENADSMRFGVMAYLNVDGTATRGGVLRSPLKYLGPNTIVPNGTPGVNARAEINANGTHVADPEGQVSGDIVSSGVINYLNKFGKTGTKRSLKSQDTVSEMFYEATRYLRGFESPTPEFITYPGADTAAARDGFSANTTWPANTVQNLDGRPIQYSCQRSYFVGIGDTNAWCDSWGPGNSFNDSACGAPHNGGPTDPDGINVTTLGNAIGAHEGLGDLGTTWVNTGRANTYHISSYAYWANLNDILADDANKPWTIGRQTAQTYWVDVRETGSFNGTVVPKNQYWLAGKYGGFDTQGGTRTLPPEGFDPTNNTYFTGERPDKLISALRAVFDNIRDAIGTSAAAGLTSSDLTTAGGAFTVQYDSRNWTGDLIGKEISFEDDGSFNVSDARWSAADELDELAAGDGWSSTRKVVSFNPDSGRGVRFVFSATPGPTTLTSTQYGQLGATAAEQQDQINYIRGDRSDETGASAKYRPRQRLLGDIVSAQPVFVGAPDEDLSDEFNEGYSAFVEAQRNRTPVVYAAANDGMLHAFNADLTEGSSTGGRELFAFIPSFAISGPSSPATPAVDGIAGRSSPLYRHRFLVDATPTVASVDFARTQGATATSAQWRTLLVGGLGKGGRGFYALDITSPSDWTSEANVSGKVLWEFTNEDLGFSYGQPIITKTAKHGWVVIVTSGYNNIRGSVETRRGRGFIFILNARTGELLERIGTADAVGSESDPSGLAHATAYLVDSGDGTAESVYAGDLLGNLWRFDLRGNPTNYPAATRIATLDDGAGNPQPVTTKPRVAIYPDTIERWVFVGTGKLLDQSDRSSDQQQTFYALRDGIETRFLEGTTLPDGVDYPLSRSDLVAVSYDDLTTTDPSTKFEADAPMGWYLDLSGSNGDGATERIIFDPAVSAGVVAFSSNYPSEDPCSPGVTSRLYALDIRSAVSLQLADNGDSLGFFETNTSLLRPEFVVNRRGNAGAGENGLVNTLNDGSLDYQRIGNRGATAPVRLNWREVLE